MARVGSIEWANQTEGRLRFRDRADLLVVQGVPTLLEFAWANVGSSIGVVRPIDLTDLGPIIPYIKQQTPTTSLAQEAEKLCRTVSDSWLIDHCHRTFAFGLLLGAKETIDPEKLFVMSMLHDVGLTAAYAQGVDPGHVAHYNRPDAACFAVRGARVAEAMAAQLHSPAGRKISEAICRHLNSRVKRSQGVEAHLLNLASSLDVGGLRYDRLPESAVDSVAGHWPRGGQFAEDLWKAWGGEAEAHPGCRGQFLNQWGRFKHRIFNAPFEA